MRPIHLTIEGLRSFRSPVSLDFTGRDQVAIVGDTGAGKSSILEAITYALYGQTTFTARANQELMNDTSMRLRVVLRFHVSGETWEVVRTLRRSGQGDVGQVRALLRRIGDDDANIEQVEQVRRVNQRIVELLGLDSDAFLRTVVLPQGRFARLLVEDDPRDRSRILRQVWRTDELEAAGELVGKARQESEMLRVRLEQMALEYPDDPAAHLEQLQEAFDRAHQREVAASEDEKAASAARETVLASEDAQEAASGVIETLRALSLEQAVNRLVPIAKLDRQLDDEDATLKKQQAQLEDALSRIPTDDGPTREEVAATLTTLQGLGALASSSEEAAAALRVSVASASKKHTEAQLLTEKAATAQNRAAEHAAERPPLDQAARAALERRNRVEQGHTRCAERSAASDEYRKRIETLQAEEAECAQRLQTALQTQVDAALEMTAADEQLAASRRSESAAAAAHDLHPGDACPICRRDLPGEWKAPDATGLIEAAQVAKAARHAAKAADSAVTRLQTEGKTLDRQITDAQAELVAAAATFQKAREELAQDVDLSAGAPFPERDVLVGPFEAVCTETSRVLAEHDQVAEALREEATRQDKEAGIAQGTAAGADELAIQSRSNVTQALRQLEAAIRTIPQAFRPRLDLPTNAADLREVDMRPVGEQTKSAQERKQVLEARRSERDRKRGEIDIVRDARAALARRRADDVEGSIKELVGELHAHRDILVESVSRLGLDAAVPPALSAQEVDELESHIGELRNKSAVVLSAADERLREAAGREEAARAELAAIGERLDAEIDIRDIDAVVRSTRTKADDARFDERHAKAVKEQFSAIIDDVRSLRSLLQDVQDKEHALKDLDDALKPGAFLKWLTLRRSRRLLVHASCMLDEMSGGKYAFVDPGEAEEEWLVLDADSGQPRSPASLSGGEQFIASLSLALGMVEMMARSGGRLESLFLDEGFGSLDRNNLDAAVQALGTVAARGRMVGVISHVRAVAEQIEHVLAVTRNATGSTAEWLTSQQREQLSESETGLEVTSAMAGLLE